MKAPAIVIAALVVLATISSSAYRVMEVEQAIITQFGEPVGEAVTEPGLHFKLPFIQKVHRFDKRWLDWDGEADEMPTGEKTYIVVDNFARWRIVDPLKFFTSVRDERGARSRLSDIITGETRNVIAAHNLIEVVRSSNRPFDAVASTAGIGMPNGANDTKGTSPEAQEGRTASDAQAPNQIARKKLKIVQGREKLTELILQKAAVAVPDYGIELRDVLFQRVNYTKSVQDKVFERMITERQRIAERHRSEGEGKSAEILGRKERELKRIESDAYRQVQEVKGRADAQATDIYAAAYTRDPKLYQLLRSLEGYKTSVDGNTTFVLSTDSDYFKPIQSMQ